LSGSARYVLYNGLTAALRRMHVPYLRIRYEDFVADPRGVLTRILDLAQVEGSPDLSFIGDGEVTLSPNHTVDCNPVRFSTGTLRLRVDDEWRRKMSRGHRLLVTTLTSPMLRSYGYTGRRAS